MRLPLDKIKRLYTQLLADSAGEQTGTSVYIFIANDCDSICSFKILSVSSSLPNPLEPA
jgi:hypothetical protein